jgi:hypothetical protein
MIFHFDLANNFRMIRLEPGPPVGPQERRLPALRRGPYESNP